MNRRSTFFVFFAVAWSLVQSCAPTPGEKSLATTQVMRPTLEADFKQLASTAQAHLTYYGGPVVSNIQVVIVLWGQGTYLPEIVRTAPAPSISSFYSDLFQSSYTDWLNEYDTAITSAQGTQGTNQTIGHGTLLGQYTITPANTNHTVTDFGIQSELLQQIVAGNVPQPTYDTSGQPNTYYAIFFPSEIAVEGQGKDFCSYHGAAPGVIGLGPLLYGVHPDMGTIGTKCGLGHFNLYTPFNVTTYCVAHELIEAITDPQAEFASSMGPPIAWFDFDVSQLNILYGEAADICIYQGDAPTMAGSDGADYAIHPMWSNVANACIIGRSVDDFDLSAAPIVATIQPGRSAQFTIATTLLTGTADNIALLAHGLPFGVTGVFSPNPVISGTTSTLTLTAANPEVALTSFTITGVSATNNHAATVWLGIGLTPAIAAQGQPIFSIGVNGAFHVLASGSPSPALSAFGLPAGLSFVDSGDGTGQVLGTPALGTVGSYNLAITAVSSAGRTTRDFTLQINKGTQTISLTGAPLRADPESTFTFSATPSASSQPLVIAATGPCSLQGTTVTMADSPGVCLLKATQAGDNNFNAAAQVTIAVASTLPGDASTLSSCNVGAGTASLASLALILLLVKKRTRDKARVRRTR